MAKQDTKQVSEIKAAATGVHVSPRKARLVADLIRSLSVQEARTELGFLTQKAAKPILKLLNQAMANASHNFQVEAERLFIKKFTVDGGPVFLRYKPRAQGRAMPVRKRTSHLNLVLGVSDVPIKLKKQKTEIRDKAETTPVVPKESQAAPVSPRRSFLRRFLKSKKGQDTSQVAPRQDLKAKPYTSFDRRGNM